MNSRSRMHSFRSSGPLQGGCKTGILLSFRRGRSVGRGDAVLREPGCEHYELHRDVADPSRLLMLERWRDEEAIAMHGEAQAFRTLAKAPEGRATLSVASLAHI